MAQLLNKDPRLYEAERERFLRELRQFHLNQRCAIVQMGFWRFIVALVFFKRKGSRRHKRCRQVMAGRAGRRRLPGGAGGAGREESSLEGAQENCGRQWGSGEPSIAPWDRARTRGPPRGSRKTPGRAHKSPWSPTNALSLKSKMAPVYAAGWQKASRGGGDASGAAVGRGRGRGDGGRGGR